MGWPIVSVSWVSVKPREKVAIEVKQSKTVNSSRRCGSCCYQNQRYISSFFIFCLKNEKSILEARLASTLIEEVNISVFVDRSTASQRLRRVKWELFSAINLCGFVSDALTERRQFAAVC